MHTGAWCVVRVAPMPWGTGLRMERDGVGWLVTPDAVVGSAGQTVLGHRDTTVKTPEHLLAALVLAGITDACITVVGPEVPILDGSAAPWWHALQQAGVERGPLRPAAPTWPARVQAAGGHASWDPRGPDRTEVFVDFADGPRGHGAFDHGGTPPARLLSAPTFVLAHQASTLRRLGRGRGAHPGNTRVLGRHDDGHDAVLHKLLDALGDRALGGPVHGHLIVHRPSHALHHALWRAVRRLALGHRR